MGGFGRHRHFRLQGDEEDESSPKLQDDNQLATSYDIGSRPLQVRLPVLEQVGVQLGAAFATHSRPLNSREISVAEPVFQRSIDYKAVRLVQSPVVSSPTTLGNVIRRDLSDEHKRKRYDDVTLIHELAHIWQYQTQGSQYIASASCAHIFEHSPYVIHAAQLRAVRSIRDLSAERQATVVEIYYNSMQFRSSDPHVRAKRLNDGRLWDHMTNPNDTFDQDPEVVREQFRLECAQLERLIAEVRRATPIHAHDRYLESLYGPAAHTHAVAAHNTQAYFPTVPVFRIDF
ncbi:MAG: hypothetical protein RL701_7748 [Pseudomonadota bacterium]|jgi:hypothetical protein